MVWDCRRWHYRVDSRPTGCRWVCRSWAVLSTRPRSSGWAQPWSRPYPGARRATERALEADSMDERPGRPWHVFATYAAAVAGIFATTGIAIETLHTMYPD